MERVKAVMKPYTVALKNVRFKYKARTECVMIDFRSDKEREAYNEAYEEYLKYLYELRGQRGHGIVAARLVAMMKFRQKAEEIRSPQIASRARNAVVEGSQVIVGSNFKSMLRGVWLALTKTYNVPEERIGFITGGQSAEERQRHVDAFQRGEKDYMLLTVAAGGVGISLHHEDTYANAKPRHIILPPTWSAIDLIQCVGRSHRLTSCSNTLQEVIWYRNTIEERVAAVVQNKVACINKAVTAKEQWSSLFAPDVDDELGNVNEDEDEDEDHTLDEGMFE
jgi:SNF2 family DNA or RNA helicase